jgi:asparagine synthase (glutamine-hydrolysing)
MCGFIGLVGSVNSTDLEKIKFANQKIIHRGPNDDGIASGEWWGLGFRRLSVLDLSEIAHQPMKTSDGRAVIVFNGEIYNYLEIKNKLKSYGHKFKGSGDTEVLLALYQFYNGDIVKVLKRCNGMFAFALVDEERKKLIFARDRLGVKPLRFAKTKNGLVFSSEIKSILPFLGQSPNFSLKALLAFLRLGFIPSWLSIYEDIITLRPGHWGEWSLATKCLTINRYWSPKTDRVANARSEGDWVESSLSLLKDATKIRLNSDVPVGLFLSGGIDSGLVAALVKESGHSDIIAHHIRFPGWKNDESILAKKTAAHLDIPLQVHDAEIPSLDDIHNIVTAFDEPFADASAIVTSLVCEKASMASTVILSGDGGDESFGGYSEYSRIMKWQWIELLPNNYLRRIGNLFSQTNIGKLNRIGARISLNKDIRSAWSHVFPCDTTLENLMPVDCIKNYLFNPESLLNHVPLLGVKNALDRAQLTDMSVYMVDDVLKKVDMMSMKHSLEVRSPFLDYRLADLALSIPPAIRIKKREPKYVLRQIAKQYLPMDVIKAPKRGFGVPLKKYMFQNDSIRPEIKEMLFSLTSDNLFEKNKMEQFINKANYNSSIDANHIYRLFSLSIWKTHFQ